MTRLDLVPIYLAGRSDLLRRLSAELERRLDLGVRTRRPWFDPELAFDSSRGQYSSTTLLRLLLDDPTEANDMVLAVASVDLFAPVLTYVFGEAQLDGRAAVVSTHRLHAEAYGLPADDELLFERLLKEALHELGHVYGLVHCRDPRCVMISSTYVEDIDQKPAAHCTACLKRMHGTGQQAIRQATRGGPTVA